MKNILSIDWDYFIEVTDNQRACLFPDGGNEKLLKSVQNFIWCSRYASTDKLRKISVDIDEINNLLSLIERYKKDNTQFCVYDSHKKIKRLIEHDHSVNVFNIDFHHDCCEFSDDVDCGNWARLLNFRKLYWIRREDSQDDVGPFVDYKYKAIHNLMDNLQELADGIDYVFICRSPMWMPPHLDSYFESMVLDIADIIGQDALLYLDHLFIRWDEDTEKNIEEMKKVQNILLTRMKGKLK